MFTLKNGPYQVSHTRYNHPSGKNYDMIVMTDSSGEVCVVKRNGSIGARGAIRAAMHGSSSKSHKKVIKDAEDVEKTRYRNGYELELRKNNFALNSFSDVETFLTERIGSATVREIKSKINAILKSGAVNDTSKPYFDTNVESEIRGMDVEFVTMDEELSEAKKPEKPTIPAMYRKDEEFGMF